ncbi:MAG: hypothetical protein PHP46_01900 [Candidatus Omnitrophica bacterium]|nr:hypothetical protein [Candidatus Omnitrophota bacterium]
MRDKIKTKILAKSVLKGVLGIGAEILLTLVFISVGVVVCLLWWSIIK